MKHLSIFSVQTYLLPLVLTLVLLCAPAAMGYLVCVAQDSLVPGSFTEKHDSIIVCMEGYTQLKQVATFEASKDGCGDYHYMIVRYGYDEAGQAFPLDTLGQTTNELELLAWYNNYWIPGDSAGEFSLRAFVHDDGCTPQWQPCNGEVTYEVLDALNPGRIQVPEFGRDTVYLKDGKYKVTVQSLEPASGGSGRYEYEWLRGVMKIAHTEQLKGYPITNSGFVRLRRNVKDQSGCDVRISEGVYELIVFDELLPGEINERPDLEYCTVERAKSDVIIATPAAGGSLTYLYQWFIQSGDELTPIEGATECDLPLSSVNLVDGMEYTFVRKVKDNTRFSEWILSANKQTVRMVPKPEVRILENEACACNGEISIYYEILHGDVDMYAIKFSPELAAAIGHTDTLAYIAEPRIPGTIIISGLPQLPEGEYSMTIRLGISCAAKTLEEVDCYSENFTIKVVNGLDGYVLQKFDRILLVDNGGAEGRLHFNQYQWYKNGQLLPGEVNQDYQEGDILSGSYFVRLRDTSNRSYRSCSIHMFDAATTVDQLTIGGLDVYPVPAEAGEMVVVRGDEVATIAIYTCSGELVSTIAAAGAQTTFAAPMVSGLYFIRLQAPNGSSQIGKLIVK